MAAALASSAIHRGLARKETTEVTIEFAVLAASNMSYAPRLLNAGGVT